MSKKILVIEDESETRNIFLRCLAFESFNAIGAKDGSAGIAMATQHRPDLVVCDIMMPDIDGYGVLSALRSQPTTRAIPFIFLTAKATMEELREGMVQGADDYLTKPCTVEQFLEAITARLSRQEALQNANAQTSRKSAHRHASHPSE
ncbi:MAG: response regulator [Cyanobacteria bacterium J06632_3]